MLGQILCGHNQIMIIRHRSRIKKNSKQNGILNKIVEPTCLTGRAVTRQVVASKMFRALTFSLPSSRVGLDCQVVVWLALQVAVTCVMAPL